MISIKTQNVINKLCQDRDHLINRCQKIEMKMAALEGRIRELEARPIPKGRPRKTESEAA